MELQIPFSEPMADGPLISMANLKGRADIAVIVSQTIRIMEEKGVAATKDFIRSLS